MRAIDLFAGAGGWDHAARELGIDPDGVEIMDEARATRTASGLITVARDVRHVHPEPGAYRLVLGSPPCQTFSPAGNGAGRRALDAVLTVVDSYRRAVPLDYAAALALMGDERTALVVEPLRIILACTPEYVALEQVAAVAPVWDAYADVLAERGYSVATGVLNAEQYGVPQTRRRAVLLARRDGVAARLPEPTHSRYYPGDPGRLDPGVLPWVSMAEALGWPEHVEVVSNYGTGGDPANRGRRTAGQPSATITSKADRMKVVGDGRRALTEAEAAALQTLPPGIPFQGYKTHRMEQIGNAVPRKLARAVLAELTSGWGLAA